MEGMDPVKPFQCLENLQEHGISLCAMSEVRWRGCGTMKANEYLYLFSGLPLEPPVSLYGVALVLNPEMQRAWERAGCEVKYVSERLIKVKLEIEGRTFHVISVYAPTLRASEQDKDRFYEQLKQLTLDKRSGEEHVILGDFNARVGTRQRSSSLGGQRGDVEEFDDLVVGDFGLPELNVGRLLLDFCRGQCGKALRVMSTFFRHNNYGTWQHNRTKQWHLIDHVLVLV